MGVLSAMTAFQFRKVRPGLPATYPVRGSRVQVVVYFVRVVEGVFYYLLFPKGVSSCSSKDHCEIVVCKFTKDLGLKTAKIKVLEGGYW